MYITACVMYAELLDGVTPCSSAPPVVPRAFEVWEGGEKGGCINALPDQDTHHVHIVVRTPVHCAN